MCLDIDYPRFMAHRNFLIIDPIPLNPGVSIWWSGGRHWQVVSHQYPLCPHQAAASQYQKPSPNPSCSTNWRRSQQHPRKHSAQHFSSSCEAFKLHKHEYTGCSRRPKQSSGTFTLCQSGLVQSNGTRSSCANGHSLACQETQK